MTSIGAHRAIPALICAVAAYSVALGAVYAALGVALKHQDYSSTAIAVSAAMTPLGLMSSAAILSRWGRGSVLAWLIAGICGTAAVMVLHSLLPNYAAWLVLRFLLGFVANMLFLFGESALMMVLDPSRRGKILGTYNGLVTLGYATGPFLVGFAAASGSTWVLAMFGALVLCALLPVLWARKELDFPLPKRETPVGVFRLFAIAPALFVASAATAIFDNGFLALFPAYAMDSGLSAQTALFLLGFAMVGATVLQWPIGTLCDRWGAIPVLFLTAGTTIFTMLALPFAIEVQGAAALLLFIAGGGAFGVYSAVLVLVSERFNGRTLVLAKALLTMMWGTGSFAGVPVVGAAMDHIATDAFSPAVIWPFALVILLICYQLLGRTQGSATEEHHAEQK